MFKVLYFDDKSSILTPVIVSNWLGSTAFGIHKSLPASSGRCPGIPWHGLQASTTNQSINQINLHWKSSTSESHVTEMYSESWTYQNCDLFITNNHHKLNPFKSKPSNYYQQQRLFLYIVINLFFVIMA